MKTVENKQRSHRYESPTRRVVEEKIEGEVHDMTRVMNDMQSASYQELEKESKQLNFCQLPWEGRGREDCVSV